jgi:hypothetical protein
MSLRKLLIGLVSAVIFTVGFGSAVIPASAELRTFIVTLQNHEVIQVSADLPAGASAEQVRAAAGISEPVASVTAGPVAAQDPAVTTTPETTTTETAPATTPTTPTTPEDDAPVGAGDKPQRPTKIKSKAKPKGSTSKDPAVVTPEPTHGSGGAPTASDPTFSLATPGAAPVGVPNFFIDKFRIPPFLLPIYQAAGVEYGIRWEVLAAINEIETDYGRNLSVSSAGALGWMQFMPASWKQYGVDANRDGKKDPYNPVDAIFAAGRYLKAAGGDTDIRKAIFSYNHADWYVDSVVMRARLISGLPNDLVSSLTGLTQGHFPVHAEARYADDLTAAKAKARAKKAGTATVTEESNPDRRAVDIFAKAGSPAIAVQDGTITKVGKDPAGGYFVRLRDGSGNTYTYRGLAKLATAYPVPKDETVSKRAVKDELGLGKTGKSDPKPAGAATAGDQPTAKKEAAATKEVTSAQAPAPTPTVTDTPDASATRATVSEKERVYAHPRRKAAYKAGGREQLLSSADGVTTFKSYFTEIYGLDRKDVVLKEFKPGAQVIAGTIVGRLGTVVKGEDPHVSFSIRPAGRGAPRIDPKPILDGWKLLESTAIYRATGRNALLGGTGKNASIGQILLMSKEQLTERVLNDPRIEIYECGRRDIKAGKIDRRVLASLAFLSQSGLRPTVTALECGHGEFTTSGNVSEHSTGDAVDIGAINGIRIEPKTQGAGTITDITIRRLLTLQGSMKPHQIISLMTYPGADNTLALPDHADHIHIGYHPDDSGGGGLKQTATLKPKQWSRLLDRLGKIENPKVPTEPSRYAISDGSGD